MKNHKKLQRPEREETDGRKKQPKSKKLRRDPRQERELRKRPLKYFLEEEE
jgi:hypothetical protein